MARKEVVCVCEGGGVWNKAVKGVWALFGCGVGELVEEGGVDQSRNRHWGWKGAPAKFQTAFTLLESKSSWSSMNRRRSSGSSWSKSACVRLVCC